jgi:hypothetical protein
MIRSKTGASRQINADTVIDFPSSLESRNFTRQNQKPSEAGENVMADMTREEVDAKIALTNAESRLDIEKLEGRLSAEIVGIGSKLDIAFAKLDSKIDSLATVVVEMKADTARTRTENHADNILTRWSILGLGVGIIGVFMALFALSAAYQANLISAFSAGIGAKPPASESPAK